MREPYLVLGIKLATTSPENLRVFEQMMRDLEQALGNVELTELKMPGVFVTELSSGSARGTWRQVAQILSGADDQVGDDLQWFAQLCDRRGCELAFN